MVTAARSYQLSYRGKRRAFPTGRFYATLDLGDDIDSMPPRFQLQSIPPIVNPMLPSDLRDLRRAGGFSLIKLYYGNRDIHYEAWHRARLNTMEIGLHFEADELTNARLLGAFQAKRRAIHKTLPDARIEPWDKGWARIWEPIPYERLDGDLRDDLARRLAAYITTLEPILRVVLPADVPWSL